MRPRRTKFESILKRRPLGVDDMIWVRLMKEAAHVVQALTSAVPETKERVSIVAQPSTERPIAGRKMELGESRELEAKVRLGNPRNKEHAQPMK